MKKHIIRIIDDKFFEDPLPFIGQSVLAGLFLGITFLLIWNINPIVVAGIGSTAFILFALPHSVTAAPKSVIGGHIISMFIGMGCYYLPHDILAGCVAVALCILIMTITDTEHPPAASTALGIAVEGFNSELITFIVIASILLALFQHLIFKHLRNLF